MREHQNAPQIEIDDSDDTDDNIDNLVVEL